MKNRFARAEQGSVITYILLVMFLIGILMVSMTEGPKRSAQTQQLDDLVLSLKSDISLIESSVNDCILVYSAAIDRDGDGDKDETDNPNPPFPLVYNSATGYATTGPIAQAICPGAPPAPLNHLAAPPADEPSRKQLLIGGQSGRAFKALGNTALYTTTYTTDTTEGVYVRITRATPHLLWTESISRLNAAYSTCKAATVTAAGDCVNGCFYYWIKRLPTSVLGPEAGCP